VDAHRHQWSVVNFFVERDTPMVGQGCACGAERATRAWDRFWEPLAPPPEDPLQASKPGEAGDP